MNKPSSIGRALKVIPIGNSAGVILPKDLLTRLGVGAGDSLSVIETSEGWELRRHEPEFEEQMTIAREVMQRRRAALRELAK